jgi:uncharacterized protein YbaP (TraB family)
MRKVSVACAIVVTAVACGRSGEGVAPPAPGPIVSDAARAAPAMADAPATPPSIDNHALALTICPAVRAPYLFRVEKHERTSYLLGTRHLGVGLARMPVVVTDRLKQAKVAVFEVAPGDESAEDAGPHPSLADAVGKDAWAHYRALVGDDAAAAVEHEKPGTALILMMAAFEDPTTSLDGELETLAQSSQVPTRGLEAAAFQDTLIDRLLDVRALEGAIATTASRDDLRKETVDDLGDYCTGARMDRSTRDEDDMRRAGYSEAEIARYDEALLFGRNRAWIPQLEKIFDDGDAFVAVGVDHLLGDRGVIAALQKDGYQVTRVAN